MRIMIRSLGLAPVFFLSLLLPQSGKCFYNPSTGRWLSRDPIVEAGGLNLFTFTANAPIAGIDRLGLNYYIVVERGTCGVHHRAIVGDDGNGGSYKVEIYPDVSRWYQEYRRLCGKGKLDYHSLPGNATNWISGEDIIGVQEYVATSAQQDADLAKKAKSLDGKDITYCLGLQDCRAVEKCTTTGKTLSERINAALEAYFTPIIGPIGPY
jgi:hypothetical protein